MGKSSGQTIGYWYRPAYHMGLCYGPIDAFLEFRGGQLTAWSGEITASGTFHIENKNLWGGEKDQGGISGDVDLLFGEPTQQPSIYLRTLGQYLSSGDGSLLPYLCTIAGSQPPANPTGQVPAWRGLASIVFKGGYYGAMNPYPQKASYKLRKIQKGWDGDPGDGSACWYAAKASIAVTGSSLLPPDASGWEYQVLAEQADPGNTNLDVPTSGWLEGGTAPFGSGPDLPAPPGTNWPGHTVLWIRRTVTIAATGQQTLRITAENGCVVFINGAIAAAANRANADISYNDQNVVLVPLAAGQTYTIAVKAFDEIPVYPNDRTYLTIEISAPGLTAMNPAHILYYARTQQHMGREPTANMNDASFTAAADWYFAQGFGLCATYDASQESIDAFIARIEKVAGCSMTRSPADGLWYLDVANGAYTLADLPILVDDDILAFTMQPATLDSAINSVSVQFFDPQQKATVSTRPVEALSLVSAYGRSHQDTSYPEIPTSGLALRVAQRDLQTTATPTHGFEITATRVAHGWRKGTYFRLQAPKHGIADMVCIVGDPDSGTLASGAIKFTAVEDIYNLPSSSFAEQETGVDSRPPQIPLGIANQAAFEAPYIEVVRSLSHADLAALPSDAGYLMTVAQDPGISRDYSITVSTDGGATYADEGNGPWCPTALIVEGDALTDAAPATAFTITGAVLLTSVVVGQAALWDAEICRVDAIDASAGTLTLGRGCADSVPQAHVANSRIWFYDGFAGKDTTEYTDGESIEVQLLTNTGTAQLDPGLATPIALTFNQRQFRPYAPAQLKVNGAWYPSVISSQLAIAAVDRNRVTEADQLVDTTQAAVAPEAGNTYTLRLYNENDVLVRTVNGLASPVYTWLTADEKADSGLPSGGPAIAWTPASLTTPPPMWTAPNSALQFDIAGNLKRWGDLSASGANYWGSNSASDPSSTNPTWVTGQNGLKIVRFNNANSQIFSGAGTSNGKNLTANITALAIFFVGSPTKNAGSLQRLLVFSVNGSGNTRAGMTISSNNVTATQRRLDADAGASTSQVQPDSAFHIYASEHDWTGQTVKLRIDGGTATSTGTSQGSGATANTASTDVGLMGSSSTAGQYASGDVGETIVLNYIPSTADRQLIEGYLAWKWGIQANLPSGHPYKTAPPGSVGDPYRINGRIRFELESLRDAATSFQHHNVTVRRAGYGMNYGMFYGGHA